MTPDTRNPYAPPQSNLEAHPRHRDERSILREAIRSWELFRVVYNVLLFMTGMGSLITFSGFSFLDDPEFFPGMLFYGVMANLFFTLGPALEAYWIAWRGVPMSFRHLLFGLGLVASLLLTFACGLGYGHLVPLTTLPVPD